MLTGEQNGGSARGYLAWLITSSAFLPSGFPRQDGSPGPHIYPGHVVPRTRASAAARAFQSCSRGVCKSRYRVENRGDIGAGLGNVGEINRWVLLPAVGPGVGDLRGQRPDG